jgi:hypothetical protein
VGSGLLCFCPIIYRLCDMETIEILGKLFDSVNRVKMMRLFLLNPEISFSTQDISKRSKVTPALLRREIGLLRDAGLIKKHKNSWQLDPEFPFTQQLVSLLVNTEPFKRDEIARRFKNTGKIKLVIVSGIFISNEDSRADILVIGDYLKKASIEKIIHNMEAELGRELRYSVLDTEEFKYRIGIYDKFIRDILDYPHEKIINKLDVPAASS